MRYLSVCSGIEAATVAWHPLGWQPVAVAEIDKFPSAVLSHHYPTVPNWGDLTKFHEWPDATIDLLVGGTPCQSFSVAGLRAGLADPRGNLAVTYLAVADKYRPRWLVWENVPGVLSSGGGRDFGAFLGGLAELGYGFAYRVLDAQYFGLAQRRARVFVVGHLGDWRRAAAVLFERESLSGHPAPGREAGEDVAQTLASRTRSGGGVGPETECPVIQCVDLAPTLRAGGNATGGDRPYGTDVDTCDSLIAHSLRADGFDASEDGTGRGTPLVPVAVRETAATLGGRMRGQDDGCADNLLPVHAFDARQSDVLQYGDQAGPLDTDGHSIAVAINENQRADVYLSQVAQSLNNGGGKPGQGYAAMLQGMAVRRLTPEECEALQGFPHGYTAIPYRGKPAADGPRYKALGNSMAVPCMYWIGRRIQMVEDLAKGTDGQVA